MGANLLLASDSLVDAETVGKKFGIPANRILSDDVIGAIGTLTSGKGLDVLVNLTAGEDVLGISAGMAPFGRVLDLSLPEETSKTSPPDFGKFKNSLSSFSVDLATVLKHRPELYGEYLDEALGLIAQGVLKVDVKEHSLEDLIPVFRLMQKGDVESHVFVVEPEMQVPVITPSP